MDDLLGMLGDDEYSAYDWSRIRPRLEAAVWHLTEEDRDARILYCWQNGEHGARMHFLGEHMLVFWWGGKPLLHLDRRRLLRAGSNPAELS